MVHTKTILALAFAGSVLGHSTVPLVKGDVAGSMTALGFDPNIPAVNKNKNVIEPDANTMPSKNNAKANGLGTLNGKTKVSMAMLKNAVANGGSGQIPQVSNTMDITYRQMVLDGRFDQSRGAAVLVDATATGNFANAVKANVLQPPNIIRTPKIQGTTVVGADMPMKVQMPQGLQCTGPQNTCLVRVVNGKNEGNNLWGGHFVVQQVQPNSAVGGTPAGANGNPAYIGSPGTHARDFSLAKNKKILVRDGGVSQLADQLSKIAVRDETDVDLVKRDVVTEPTLEDMLAFEAANPL